MIRIHRHSYKFALLGVVTILHAQNSTAPSAVKVIPDAATTQYWTPGWFNLNEPLNYSKSKIVWSVSATRKLTVTYTLVSAAPTKLYQVGLNFFCTTFRPAFGQFPVELLQDGNCTSYTEQGLTATVAATELGVVLTDDLGTGSFKVVIGPIAPGNYSLEFYARDGAGCGVTGGSTVGSACNVDFQSPGPFGTATEIVVP
jgi:hypothetical protein